MIGIGRDACRDHRAGLAVIATRREAGDPATHDHLARCSRCRAEIQGLALASLALQRLADDDSPKTRRPIEGVGSIEAMPGAMPSLAGAVIAATRSDPSWLAVRRRATATRGPLFRWRGHLAGLIVGAGLATAIIAPLPAKDSRPLYDSGTLKTVSGSRDLADQKAEDEWLWANQHTRKESPRVDIVLGPYDPSVFGEGPFEPVHKPSDIVGLRAR